MTPYIITLLHRTRWRLWSALLTSTTHSWWRSAWKNGLCQDAYEEESGAMTSSKSDISQVVRISLFLSTCLRRLYVHILVHLKTSSYPSSYPQSYPSSYPSPSSGCFISSSRTSSGSRTSTWASIGCWFVKNTGWGTWDGTSPTI